jgi:DNA-directed RNA polymerase specialized sigma24 family protein
MRTIVIPLSVGYSTAEIASTLGTSSSWVLNRLNELRRELGEAGMTSRPSPF